MKIKFYKVTIDQNILIAKTWGVTLVIRRCWQTIWGLILSTLCCKNKNMKGRGFSDNLDVLWMRLLQQLLLWAMGKKIYQGRRPGTTTSSECNCNAPSQPILLEPREREYQDRATLAERAQQESTSRVYTCSHTMPLPDPLGSSWP